MVRRLTLTDEKTINLAKNLSTLEGFEDEKDVIKEAVLLLWEKRGGELISNLSKISPVAKFLDDAKTDERTDVRNGHEDLISGFSVGPEITPETE